MRTVLFLFLLGLALGAAADDRGAIVRMLSPPDCVDAANFVSGLNAAPGSATYLRVQHVGDPGTAELEGAVANVVTWDVGQVTGLSLHPSTFARTQRAYHNAGPPDAASAFQLGCNGAGFFLDSRRFSHRVPVELAGAVVSVARDLAPGVRVFRRATSALTIGGTLRVPTMRVDAPPVTEGTAQVSFFYYAVDVTTGAAFAHVIALYDNRPMGVNGAGTEAVSADAFTPFVTSPLAHQVASGLAPQFVRPGPGSATMQVVSPWSEPRDFRAQVEYPQFKMMLMRLARERGLAISLRPEDYRIALFGVLAEIFPGTGTAHEVALGGSVVDLALAESYRELAPVPVVEFHHAARDHYFVSARAEEIEALDTGGLPGWRRTGASFLAWPGYLEGAAPVCRFYLPPGYGDSHFFSASQEECRTVSQRFPNFILEDAEVMYAGMPDASGECPAGVRGVFRLWNARADTNHRYTTDVATRKSMIDAGWIAEGHGPQGIAFCEAEAMPSTAGGSR